MKRFGMVFAIFVVLAVFSFPSHGEGQAASSLNFTHPAYGYSLDIPVGMQVETSSSEDPDEDNLVLQTADQHLQVTITVEKPDAALFEQMRLQMGDTLSDEEVLTEWCAQRKSYFYALADKYRSRLITEDISRDRNSIQLKIFGDYADTLYGLDASSLLFNVLKTGDGRSLEQSHLIMLIPSPAEKAFYTLDFATSTPGFDQAVLASIAQIINSFKFPDMPEGKSRLSLTSDTAALEKALTGIFPLTEATDSDNPMSDPIAGYSVRVPASFIRFRDSSLTDLSTCTSMKAGIDTTISILSEPVVSETPIPDKIAHTASSSPAGIRIDDAGTVDLNGKNYLYLSYSTKKDGKDMWVLDYYIVENARLYTLRMESFDSKYMAVLADSFLKLAASMTFTPPVSSSAVTNDTFSSFANREGGYRFSYPESWDLAAIPGITLENEAWEIRNPNTAGGLQVLAAEASLTGNQSPEQTLGYISGTDMDKLKKNIRDYNAPYLGKPFTLLSSGMISRNGFTGFTRLVNYLDDNGRVKLCYSVEYIRGNKLVSLFITVSEYLTRDGVIADNELAQAVRQIAASFQPEDTPEYQKRLESGETRNRRVVFLETLFRQLLGPGAQLTRIQQMPDSGSLTVWVDGIPAAGIYQLKLDYAGRQVEMISSVLKSQTMSEAEKLLRDRYAAKEIKSITQNFETSSIEITATEASLAADLTHTYDLSFQADEEGVRWDLKRRNHPQELQLQCIQYMVRLFSTVQEFILPPLDAFSVADEYAQAGKKMNIPIYADFGTSSGYFTLQVDPGTDTLSLISFQPGEKPVKPLTLN